MPKISINEDDLSSFALKQAKPGEAPLVGVYAGLKNKEALGAGIVASLFTNSALGGAVGGGLANIWCLLFANNNRVCIGIYGYVANSIQDVIEIERKDISEVKAKKGLLYQLIIIRLNDNHQLKFRISRFGVLGQPNHKQRLSELLKIFAESETNS